MPRAPPIMRHNASKRVPTDRGLIAVGAGRLGAFAQFPELVFKSQRQPWQGFAQREAWAKLAVSYFLSTCGISGIFALKSDGVATFVVGREPRLAVGATLAAFPRGDSLLFIRSWDDLPAWRTRPAVAGSVSACHYL
jgi:hypothetical protein